MIQIILKSIAVTNFYASMGCGQEERKLAIVLSNSVSQSIF